jgi:hypothetical protein
MTPHVPSPFCSDPYCSNCDFRLCGAAYDLDGVEQQVKELRHWKEEETGPKEVLAKGQGTFCTPKHSLAVVIHTPQLCFWTRPLLYLRSFDLLNYAERRIELEKDWGFQYFLQLRSHWASSTWRLAGTSSSRSK